MSSLGVGPGRALDEERYDEQRSGDHSADEHGSHARPFCVAPPARQRLTRHDRALCRRTGRELASAILGAHLSLMPMCGLGSWSWISAPAREALTGYLVKARARVLAVERPPGRARWLRERFVEAALADNLIRAGLGRCAGTLTHVDQAAVSYGQRPARQDDQPCCGDWPTWV